MKTKILVYLVLVTVKQVLICNAIYHQVLYCRHYAMLLGCCWILIVTRIPTAFSYVLLREKNNTTYFLQAPM